MTDKVLCRYFMYGACDKGEACRFSHDVNNTPASMVCRYYLAGCCVYGDRCRYDHVRPDWAQTTPRSVQQEDPSTNLANLSLSEGPPSEERPSGSSRDPAGAGSSATASTSTAAPAVTTAHAPSPDGSNSAWQPRDGGASQGEPVSEVVSDLELWAAEYEDDDKDGVYYGLGDWEHRDADDPAWWAFHAAAQEASWEGGLSSESDGEGGENAWGPSWGAIPSASLLDLPVQQGGVMPAAGAGGEGGEDAWGAAPPPPEPRSERGLCSDFLLRGWCRAGAACKLAHGRLCTTCQRWALHPWNSADREEHAGQCTARHERLAAVQRSAQVECCICLERVMSKAAPAERKFGLLECNHAFCLGCIRSWRSHTEGGADVDSALRTCPVCRTTSWFVTPSLSWPASAAEKDAVRAGYKARLAATDCKHWAFGAGRCPFGTSCFYRHVYRDGRPQEKGRLRRRVDADGETGVTTTPTLADFLSASRAGQAALHVGR